MVVTHDRAVSPGGVRAAVLARAGALAQTKLQMADAVLQLPGCRSAWGLSLVPGEMAFCPAGAVPPSGRVTEGREQAVQHWRRRDLL